MPLDKPNSLHCIRHVWLSLGVFPRNVQPCPQVPLVFKYDGDTFAAILEYEKTPNDEV